jgi:transposase-like protein
MSTIRRRPINRDADPPAKAAKIKIGFVCPQEHNFKLTFCQEAELPTDWDCPRCGRSALREDGTPSEQEAAKQSLTHWDRLLQRRSIAELEVLLAEQLQELRAATGGESAPGCES